MRAFIVRPFGTKKDLKGREIDFERVERELIAPALKRLGIAGTTTVEIARAGNIRTDMFHLLLTADLVIADLSIHNANVFYELGIRHALRDRRTFLLRCAADEVPFDLLTDRYLVYDRDDPRACLGDLAEALRQTRDSPDSDSPVYGLLRELRPQDPGRFLAVPDDFREEVERARAEAHRRSGALRLLAEECAGLAWESAGWRLVGRALMDLRDLDRARDVWERVRGLNENDPEANRALAEIYAALAVGPKLREDLQKSAQALKRLDDSEWAAEADRTQAAFLRALNGWKEWAAAWGGLAPADQRPAALRRALELHLCDQFEDCFQEDLRNYRCGADAAVMLTTLMELAKQLPAVWTAQFANARKAADAAVCLRRRLAALTAAGELSLQAAGRRAAGHADPWLNVSAAFLGMVAEGFEPVPVLFGRALGDCDGLLCETVAERLGALARLGVRAEKVEQALRVWSAPGNRAAAAQAPAAVLLFCGYALDEEGAPAYFPPDKEPLARAAIRQKVEELAGPDAGRTLGMAGGACGGDLLFHEVCADLQIPTELFLPLPREPYAARRVRAWGERFDRVHARGPVRVLAEREGLPRWLRARFPDEAQAQEYLWQRGNAWMLSEALVRGAPRVTLIALWDRQHEDRPGGPADLVRRAQAWGVNVVPLDTRQLFAP
jgi:hypothetical protein